MNILTFDIGVTNIRYALCDEQFRLSDVHTVPTRAQQGGQQIMERLLEIIGTYQHIDRGGGVHRWAGRQPKRHCGLLRRIFLLHRYDDQKAH